MTPSEIEATPLRQWVAMALMVDAVRKKRESQSRRSTRSPRARRGSR